MPSNYASVQDTPTTLDAANPVHNTVSFNAPGLNNNERPFVSFRVNPAVAAGSVTLHMLLNNQDIVRPLTFDSEPVRGLDEIFEIDILQAVGNVITVHRDAGPGNFDISDIIVTYSAN